MSPNLVLVETGVTFFLMPKASRFRSRYGWRGPRAVVKMRSTVLIVFISVAIATVVAAWLTLNLAFFVATGVLCVAALVVVLQSQQDVPKIVLPVDD